MRGAVLSPRTPPSRTYSFLAAADRSHPRFFREQRLFYFRCEISGSRAARPRARPKAVAGVVTSGPGDVGDPPAGRWVEREGEAGPRTGAKLPVVRADRGGNPALQQHSDLGVRARVWKLSSMGDSS